MIAETVKALVLLRHTNPNRPFPGANVVLDNLASRFFESFGTIIGPQESTQFLAVFESLTGGRIHEVIIEFEMFDHRLIKFNGVSFLNRLVQGIHHFPKARSGIVVIQLVGVNAENSKETDIVSNSIRFGINIESVRLLVSMGKEETLGHGAVPAMEIVLRDTLQVGEKSDIVVGNNKSKIALQLDGERAALQLVRSVKTKSSCSEDWVTVGFRNKLWWSGFAHGWVASGSGWQGGADRWESIRRSGSGEDGVAVGVTVVRVTVGMLNVVFWSGIAHGWVASGTRWQGGAERWDRFKRLGGGEDGVAVGVTVVGVTVYFFNVVFTVVWWSGFTHGGVASGRRGRRVLAKRRVNLETVVGTATVVACFDA